MVIDNICNILIHSDEESITDEVDYDNSPTKLFLSIESKEWSACIARAKEEPDEVKTWVYRLNEQGTEEWNVLPIHAAIRNSCPASVVKAFLKAYPESSKERTGDFLLAIDLAFDTPSPNDEIINALLKVNPGSILELNEEQKMNLVDYDFNCAIIFNLIEQKDWGGTLKRAYYHPEEVKTWVIKRKKCGEIHWRCLAIHAAVISNAPEKIIEWLLKQFPESVRYTDSEGKTPLELELSKTEPCEYMVNILVKACAYPKSTIVFTEGGGKHHQQLVDYDKTCTVLYKQIQSQEWDKVLKRVIAHPEETRIWVYKQKKNGELVWRHLPLHAVLKYDPPSTIVQVLLIGYLEASRCLDDQGLVPFQIALKEKKSFSDEIVSILYEALQYPTRICVTSVNGDALLTDYDNNPRRLYKLIESKQWKNSIDHLQSFPVDAKTWVIRKQPDTGKLRWRLLPIHAAIIFDCPLNVLQALLKAYPESTKCQDDHGMLPLHLAKLKKRPADVIKALADIFPEADSHDTVTPGGGIQFQKCPTLKRKTKKTEHKMKVSNPHCADLSMLMPLS